MVKNLPCIARGTGLIPDWGTKIPYAVEQPIPCTTTPEPECQHNTTKILCVATRTQRSQINNKISTQKALTLMSALYNFNECITLYNFNECFPHSSVGKESACNAGDPGSIPGLGRSLGEGKGYPL